MNIEEAIKEVKENQDALRMAIEALKERPHGEWRITFVGCECSVCKDTTLAIPMNFCPNCGSKKPEEKPVSNEWTCSCGTVNTAKFCGGCGNPKP